MGQPMLRRLLHEFVHWLHWQRGYVVSAWSADALWIGFECADCKRVTGAHIAEYRFGLGRTEQSLTPPTVWNR
jgi:hypothetical protein